MPVLFVANEFEDFDTSGGTITKSIADYYDSNYTRASIGVGLDTTSYLQGNFSTAAASFWFTCRIGSYYSSAGCVPITFTDGGTDRLRIKFSTAATDAFVTLSLYRWDGTAETLIGTIPNALLTNATNRLDFKVIYSASGTFEAYRNGILTGTVTGDLVGSSGSTTLDGLKLKAACTYIYPSGYNEVIVATGSTAGLRAKTLVPNGDGDLTAWSGGYGNVDEVVSTDTDVINSAVTGQEWSCHVTGLPAGSSGQKVRAVKISCDAAKGDSGPSALGIGVLTAGSKAYQPNQACSLTYTHLHTTLETNPVTGQPWTTAELETLQFAVRSA